MVASRLAKRLHFYQLKSYQQYYQLVVSNQHPNEFNILVDILTTNETYFFREPKHFEFLQHEVLKHWQGDMFRVWSAASSSGEEAYSLAMILADTLSSKQWEVLASDLSTKVLETARKAIYQMDRLECMDKKFLHKYCLKGVRSKQNFFKVSEQITNRVKFVRLNLNRPIAEDVGKFDVIFLRNALIYFDQQTKKQIVDRLLGVLKPKGYFFISHSESLHRITDSLELIRPSIYRKP